MNEKKIMPRADSKANPLRTSLNERFAVLFNHSRPYKIVKSESRFVRFPPLTIFSFSGNDFDI